MRPLVMAISALIVGTLVTPTTAGAAPTWQPCPDLALECTTLSVPLDYRKPYGAKIDIAVSRHKAADPAKRRGVLLLNPGGPGESGLALPLDLSQGGPQSITDAYDLIGFDPRGTGRSSPATCALTAEQSDPAKLQPYPAPDGDISASVAYARQIAKQCDEHSGTVLPFITTANTARDMDQIRALLGEPKISYFGLSGGSYLGAVYTTLFPQRSDRILLDSVVDPRDVWRSVFQARGPAIEERFEDFAKWAASRHATYQLGATPRAVRDAYLALTANLDAVPVAGWTGNLVRDQTRISLISDEFFPAQADLLQSLRRGTPEPFVPRPVDQANVATMFGTVCDDAVWPGSVALHQQQVLTDKKKYPISGGMPSNIWPCAFWPTRPVEPPVRITDQGPANVLLTQNLRDPATPLVGAVAMRAALGNRARLVTADQGGHGAYLQNGNTCLADMATAFLVNGTFPAKDVFCAKETAEPAKQPHSRQFPF